jgi:hypothetical protein
MIRKKRTVNDQKSQYGFKLLCYKSNKKVCLKWPVRGEIICTTKNGYYKSYYKYEFLQKPDKQKATRR